MKKIIVIILILFCNTINSQDKEAEKKFVYPNRSSLQKIIDSHKGSVIYLDFWASWCKPCRKEIKKMKSIKEYFKDKSVSFIYISIEGEKIKCAEAIEKDGVIEENYLMYELMNDTGYIELDKISSIPHYQHARNGSKFGPITMEDGMQKDGLVDAYENVAMGVCADECATKYEFSREDQDAFAIQSYQRSSKASSEGKFADEIVPVTIPQRRGEPIIFSEDEEFKNVIIEKIPALRAAFTKDGTVTAANASTINDGGAALILMSADKAKELNITPIAKILGYADAAHEPKWFTTAPSKALPKALAKANISLDAVDYFEFNEAFSIVGLANMKILGLTDKNVNVNGGAVSLGHPLGVSGARIVITLTSILKQNNAKIGAATICNGGGGASALIIERI